MPPDPRCGGGAYNSNAGCWPIMSDIFHSVSFLGWHRHKNGWLPVSRATYIDAASASPEQDGYPAGSGWPAFV